LKKEDKSKKGNFPYEFQVEFETRAHGNVVARCPALPGCQAQGKTQKEALDRLKAALDLYFTSAAPAFFEDLEAFPDLRTFYALCEFKGSLIAATGRDAVLKSTNGAPGSWTRFPVTGQDAKFFTPDPGAKEGAGDYTPQIYCLHPYAAPGKEPLLYAGTNLSGSIYSSVDGETWKEVFITAEDRIHALREFKGRLYAGTSSKGRIFAFDGLQWNTVGSLTETAVTCFGVFKDRLYAGTYPSGLIFSTLDGYNWEEVTSTGQTFVQCFQEFDGALYAGTSSAKGVRVFRTRNGRDWEKCYESSREANFFCMEVFENTLFAGTGNSGRILKTRDGVDWRTAHAGDSEGVRAFTLYGDYLYACAENGAGLLRSTFDMGRIPEVSDLTAERLTSNGVILAWRTDIPATTEVFYAPKGSPPSKQRQAASRDPVLRHRMHLTDLKADTEYEIKVVSTHRSSSQGVTEPFVLRTPSVPPPVLSSLSHPDQDKWENHGNLEMRLEATAPLAGFHYLLDDSPDTVPAPPEASYTEKNRVALASNPQGLWWFHAVGVDLAGNIGTTASHYRVRVDTEALPPPKVGSSTHPDPDRWVANPTPLITWETAPDLSGVAGYYVKADRDPVTVPGPANADLVKDNRLSIGPLEDGLWYVHVTAQDKAGNRGTQASHFPLRIDTRAEPPVLSSPTHPQEGQWYSKNTVEVDFTPAHDLSGMEGYYFLIDQEADTLPSPKNARFTEKPRAVFPDLKDGVWHVHVRAKDRAGNLSPTASHLTVRLDTFASPPKVASPSHAEPKRWYRDRRVRLEWEEPTELSGIEGYYYNIDRNPETVPGGSTSLFTAQRSVSFELTDDGLWYFHITTKDKAGNLDSKAVHYPIRVDSEAKKPGLSSPSHPDPETWTRDPKVTFRIAPADDLSGITGHYYLFSEDAQQVPDPATATFTDRAELTLDIPRDGTFTLSVVSQDTAGNISKEVATYKVRLDTQALPPALSSPTHPKQDAWSNQAQVTLIWKDPTDLSGVEGYHYAFDRKDHPAPEAAKMSWTTSRTATFTLPEDGVWYAHVVAKDKAGNLSPSATHRLQVDRSSQAPVVKSPTHQAGAWSKLNTPKFIWEKPQELSGVEGFYLSLDAQSHTVPGPNAGKWSLETSLTAPPLKDGRWFFHAVTKDGVGNVSQEAFHFPVWVDTTPPKSGMKALPALLDRTQVPLEWSASDQHSGVASYDLQVKAGDGPWKDWLTHVPETAGVFKGEDGKRYSFRVRARDTAGNEETFPEGAQASTTLDISPPPPVKELKVVPKAGGDIELTWSQVEDPVSGTDYYRIYRWVEGGPKLKLAPDGEVKGPRYLDQGEALQEGVVYYYCVQAVDRMGNEQHEGNQTAASLSDHGVGTPTVTSPSHSSDDWTSNPSPLLTWTAPADATGIAGYYYLLDQSPNSRPRPEEASLSAAPTSPLTVGFTDERRLEPGKLDSGIWYFHLLAKDRAGNVSDHPAHYRLKIDVARPEPPHVISPSHPDARWYSSNKVEFKLTCGPKLSGADGFYYAFDKKPGTVPLPDSSQRVTEGILSLKAAEPGTWYLHVVARDKAGNLSEPVHHPVLVAGSEMPPPVVACPTHPQEEEAMTNFEPFLTWEDRHDGSFKPAGYVYKVSAHEEDPLTPEDAFTAERSLQLKNIGEGTWYFHIAAVTKKGKPGVLSTRRKMIVRKMGRVSGTFLRKDGVTPIPGAKVEALRNDRGAAAGVTDGKGKFGLGNLPEGRYELRLHSDQFPVLRLKDLPVSPESGLDGAVFTEDQGLFPSSPKPGPIRFYYFLKEDCLVSLEIFDAAGLPVDRVEERKEGGAYAVTLWDAAGKTPGEYLYKITAKSLTKNAVSRHSVKKFRIEKPSKELAEQPR